MRGAAAVVLGLFYLLQASWLLQGGADLLFPRTRTVQAGDTACCTTGCGCPAEAQVRKSCCCFPGAAKEATSTPSAVPVSALEEARCGGTSDAGLDLVTFPALTGPALPPLILVCSEVEIPDRTLPQSFPDRSEEKVPI